MAQGPTGLIVAESSQGIGVYNAGTRILQTYEMGYSETRLGIGGTASGVIAAIENYTGRDTWDIVLLNARTGSEIKRLGMSRPYGFPTSAVAVSSDASTIAFSVDEYDENLDERIEQTLVAQVSTLAGLGLAGAKDPVFIGNELLVQVGDRLHMLDANLDDQGDLGVTVNERIGAASGSRDGRYIAYENGDAIWVLDRRTQATWAATNSVRRRFAPAFSPDGQYLAMLGGYGNRVAGAYVYIIKFEPSVTVNVTDEYTVESSNDGAVPGGGRIVWVEA
ncbi:MAG: hypothetical protein HC800_08275 [Phormidesmis sp. RL_2_1]|nr:hypothetical protein [Phormidesmis sp. RL_2_1]